MKAKLAATLLAVDGMVLCLAGGLSYFFLLNYPSLRTTPVVHIAVMACGVASGVTAAVIAGRRWATCLAIAEGLLTGLFVLLLYVGFALPRSEPLADGRLGPDFTLPDQAGRSVSLADYRGRGPMLLVFYRGFW